MYWSIHADLSDFVFLYIYIEEKLYYFFRKKNIEEKSADVFF